MPLVTDGNAQSKIRQGVTTEVIGESGSIAPQTSPTADQPWTDFSGYFAVLEKQGISVNLLSYVGLGTVRRAGRRRRQPPANRRRAGEDAGHRQRGDEAGRGRRLDRPHLPAQRLCDARRAGRALHAGGGGRRTLRLAPAPRRQAAARRHRGSHGHRRAREAAGARVPHQGHRPAELRPHEGSRGARRGRPRPRREGHRRRLPLRGQQHQPDGDAAAVGDGRRASTSWSSGSAIGRPAPASSATWKTPTRPGTTAISRPAPGPTCSSPRSAGPAGCRQPPTTPTRSTRACASPTPRRPPARTRSSSSSICCATRAAASAASTSSCRRTT